MEINALSDLYEKTTMMKKNIAVWMLLMLMVHACTKPCPTCPQEVKAKKKKIRH